MHGSQFANKCILWYDSKTVRYSYKIYLNSFVSNLFQLTANCSQFEWKKNKQIFPIKQEKKVLSLLLETFNCIVDNLVLLLDRPFMLLDLLFFLNLGEWENLATGLHLLTTTNLPMTPHPSFLTSGVARWLEESIDYPTSEHLTCICWCCIIVLTCNLTWFALVE